MSTIVTAILCVMMLIQPASVSADGVGTPAVTGFTPSPNTRTDGPVWIGACFLVGDEPVTVTALGRAYLEGNGESHELRLIRRDDKSLMASAAVDMAHGDPDGAGFKYAAIPEVVLDANTEYYVLSLETGGSDAWYDYTTTVVSDEALKVARPVWSSDCVTFSDANVSWFTEASYGPVNVRFHKGAARASVGTSAGTAVVTAANAEAQDKASRIAELVGQLHSQSESERGRAATALEKMGTAARAAVPDLILSLGDESISVAWKATKALTAILENDDAVKTVAIPALQESLYSGETSAKYRATRALQRLAPELLVNKVTEVDGETIVVPLESTEAFRNPGKGWVAYLFDPESNPTVSGNGANPPGYIDLIYTNYLTWAMLEPEEGQYRWDIIDQIVEHWGNPPYNKKIGLGIGVIYPTSIPGTYHVPKWLVETEGMEGHIFDARDMTFGEAGELKYEPYYWNEVFLSKWEQFMNALSDRYYSTQSWQDHIELVDICTYGMWGEWHSKLAPWPDAETQKATLTRLVDIYYNAFPPERKGSPHLVQDVVSYSSLGRPGQKLDNQAVTYSILERGSWMRRRAVGWPEAMSADEVQFIQDHWQERRLVGEWGLLYVKPDDVRRAVEHGLSLHVSYIGWGIANGPFDAVADPETGESYQEYVQKRVGYRFVLREARYPSAVEAGGQLELAQRWSQIAAAKLYERHYLRAYLVGDSGDFALDADTSFDPTTWVSGTDYEVVSQFTIPANVPAGEYELRIAMVDPETLEPAINLAIYGKDIDDVNAFGRYTLGPVIVVGQ